jgi:hypothetical protein
VVGGCGGKARQDTEGAGKRRRDLGSTSAADFGGFLILRNEALGWLRLGLVPGVGGRVAAGGLGHKAGGIATACQAMLRSGMDWPVWVSGGPGTVEKLKK